MELIGKLLQLLPVQNGEGRNGTWQKQSFVLETQDQYPKKVCCIVWGDKVNDLQRIAAGDMLKVQFSLESREFNGRWYTDVRAYRVEVMGSQKGKEENPPENGISSPPESFDLSPQPDDLPF